MLLMLVSWIVRFFFFFNDTATTEIYTLSLHDALPIFARAKDYSLAEAARPAFGQFGLWFTVAIAIIATT